MSSLARVDQFNPPEEIKGPQVFPATDIPATEKVVIDSYRSLLSEIDDHARKLAAHPELDRGYEISNLRGGATRRILRDIFERQEIQTPSAGKVALYLGGGIPRGECTRSSDADLWIVEEKIDDPFTLGLSESLSILSRTFKMQVSHPVVNTLDELLTYPIHIGNETARDVIDARKLAECIDAEQIGGPMGFGSTAIDRFIEERFKRQDEIALYSLKSLRFRRGQNPESTHHLDSFNIKEGVGGLRDILFALHLISAAERSNCIEARNGLPEIERAAINTLLHVREWMAHQREIKPDDKKHLSFGSDLVPRFEAFFGRNAGRGGAIHRLIEARIVALRLCDRIAAEHLRRGIPSSRFSILVGLSINHGSIGLALNSSSTRLRAAQGIFELLKDATRHNLPIIADSNTLEATAAIGTSFTPDLRMIDILESPQSPMEALKFLHCQGMLDLVLPGFERLVSSYYPSKHRLTGENMADRSLARLSNLSTLYPHPERDSSHNYFCSEFEKLDSAERAALVLALLIEEIPLVSGDRARQPERVWDQRIVESVPSVVAELLAPYRRLAPERILRIQDITSDIIQRKFRLRELASEPLPSDSNYIASLKEELKSKKLISLLALFSYAAFDYQLSEDHPHSRLNDVQWGRLTRISEILQGFFDEGRSTSHKMYESGSIEDQIAEQLTLPVLFIFAPNVRPVIKNLSQLVAGSAPQAPLIQITSRERERDPKRDLQLTMDLFTRDEPGLIWKVARKAHELGLKISDIQAATLDLDVDDTSHKIVVDRFQLVVPRKLVDQYGKLGELEGRFHDIFRASEEATESVQSEPKPVALSDVESISIRLSSTSQDRRVEISLPKHLLPDAIPRFSWAIATQLNGDIRGVTLDQKWKLADEGSLIATINIPENLSDSALRSKLFELLAEK